MSPGKGQVFHSTEDPAELRSWSQVQEGFDILVDTTGQLDTFKVLNWNTRTALLRIPQ